MSKLWDTYKFLLDPDTPPEEVDAHCCALTRMALEGDEEAERVVAILGANFLGRRTVPPSLMHYLGVALALRAKGHKWEHAFRHGKHKLFAMSPKERKKFSRDADVRLVLELVKWAKTIGHPLSTTSGKQKTAFEVAAEKLEEKWRDETGKPRGEAGTIPTPDNVRRIYYDNGTLANPPVAQRARPARRAGSK
jgi:hypothetical protein